MSISGIRSAVQTIIQRAGAATGVDAGYLMKTAQRESSFNPTARASTSSATGLFQFTEQTWLATVKQFGDRHGYSAYSDQIRQNSEGRYVVSGGSRQAAQGELYMAHFMGPAGSARLIDALENQPMAPAANIFPDAARANPTIFYRGGRAATVQEVYANLVRTGAAPPPMPAPEPVGFIQFAGNSRSQEVKREQEVLMALILGGGRGDENATPGSRLGGSLFSTEMLRVLADASSGRDSATARRGEEPLLG